VEPTLTFVSRSAPQIRENFNGGCDTSLPTTSAITVEATHPSGVSSVQFRSRVGSGAWTGWQPMGPLMSGPANRYRATIGTYPPDTLPPDATATISWQARVTPADGPVKTLSSTSNTNVTLTWCSLG